MNDKLIMFNGPEGRIAFVVKKINAIVEMEEDCDVATRIYIDGDSNAYNLCDSFDKVVQAYENFGD